MSISKATVIPHGTVPSITYIEPGFAPIPPARLDDEPYGIALQSMVRVCTDAIPVNRKRRAIYLAKRIVKPMPGLWGIGGGAKPNDVYENAMVRNFKRETTLDLLPSRFVYIMNVDYFWKDRAQPPQEIGCHMDSKLFAVEITDEEAILIAKNLEPTEYDVEFGLQAFTLEDLAGRDDIHPVILKAYDLIFPTRVEEVVFEDITGVHDDERRTLFPLFNMDVPGVDGVEQCKIAIIKKDSVLGKHFHQYVEMFCVLSGQAVFVVTHSKTSSVMEYLLVPGKRIVIPPGFWHEVKVTGGTVLVGFTEERYVSPEHNDHR